LLSVCGSHIRQEYPRGGLNSITGFVELGTLQIKRLHRIPVIAICPWNIPTEPKMNSEASPKERRDPLNIARYYLSLMDSGSFESRAALARYLGVSRARVTQVLNRLKPARNED
jgi:hypothetical protein